MLSTCARMSPWGGSAWGGGGDEGTGGASHHFKQPEGKGKRKVAPPNEGNQCVIGHPVADNQVRRSEKRIKSPLRHPLQARRTHGGTHSRRRRKRQWLRLRGGRRRSGGGDRACGGS